MNLHENKKLFTDAVLAASDLLDILPVYVEKDYWITRTLKMMALNESAEILVFKGGTSLFKGYGIGCRFSEDIDIAISGADAMTGNQLKTFIKKIAKEMTAGMDEVDVPGVTSKGSRYYKAMYAYPNVLGKAIKGTVNTGQLLMEINTFSNPYPYVEKELDSFIGEFLRITGNEAIIGEYGLEPFTINVLDKRQTLAEKLVALIRHSFSDNCVYDIAAKIRHFYDLHFLLQDDECSAYIESGQFKKDFASLIENDRVVYDKPVGWNTKALNESPLITNFNGIWTSLRETYQRELPAITIAEIPQEIEVAKSFSKLLRVILNG